MGPDNLSEEKHLSGEPERWLSGLKAYCSCRGLEFDSLQYVRQLTTTPELHSGDSGTLLLLCECPHMCIPPQ